jgi:hypothetical protein
MPPGGPQATNNEHNHVPTAVPGLDVIPADLAISNDQSLYTITDTGEMYDYWQIPIMVRRQASGALWLTITQRTIISGSTTLILHGATECWTRLHQSQTAYSPRLYRA